MFLKTPGALRWSWLPWLLSFSCYSDSVDSDSVWLAARPRLGGFGGRRRFGSARLGGAALRPRRASAAGASASARCLGSAACLGGSGLAAGDALVDQRLHAVGEVAGERLEQAGRLGQRRLEHAGHLREQHLARRQVGQRLDVGRGDAPARRAARPSRPARGWSGRSRAAPWPRPRRRRARTRWRPGPRTVERCSSSPAPSTARRASVFLNTLYSVSGRRSDAAQLGQLVHGEPAVLGEHRGVGLRRAWCGSRRRPRPSRVSPSALPLEEHENGTRRRHARRPVRARAPRPAGRPVAGRTHYLERDRRSVADAVVEAVESVLRRPRRCSSARVTVGSTLDARAHRRRQR